jgi:lipid II:glycine glycyltransferase (peptidoglycan interpeptide bridge formation enzyme)
MPFLAFHHQKITEFFDLRSQYLVDYLRDFAESEIASMDTEIQEKLLQRCFLKTPVIDLRNVQIEKASAYTESQKTQIQTSFDQTYEMGDTKTINNFLFFKIAYTGDEAIFYLRPYSEFPGVIGIDTLTSKEVIFRFILDPYQPVESQIQNHSPTVKQILQNIQATLEKLKPDIDKFNQNLRNQLQTEIDRRKYVSTKKEAIVPQVFQMQSKPEVKSLGSLDFS